MKRLPMLLLVALMLTLSFAQAETPASTPAQTPVSTPATDLKMCIRDRLMMVLGLTLMPSSSKTFMVSSYICFSEMTGVPLILG